MDLLTFILLVIILCVIIFLVYYFWGAKGDIALSRPVESRVDQYLDRRFQSMVEEWQLVSRPRLAKFQDQRIPEIEQDEARIAELTSYETGMKNTLASLEARLDALEKELAWTRKHQKIKDLRIVSVNTRKEITVMRKQGKPPVKDLHSFAQFTRDLCNTPRPDPAALRQCVLCGRWACETCWKDEYYTCRSCAGL